MPRSEGEEEDPERARNREMKREERAGVVGERPKRLEARTAPSGASEVLAGSFRVMTELEGRARPRMPSNSYSRGSSSTVVAAAA